MSEIKVGSPRIQKLANYNLHEEVGKNLQDAFNAAKDNWTKLIDYRIYSVEVETIIGCVPRYKFTLKPYTDANPFGLKLLTLTPESIDSFVKSVRGFYEQHVADVLNLVKVNKGEFDNGKMVSVGGVYYLGLDGEPLIDLTENMAESITMLSAMLTDVERFSS